MSNTRYTIHPAAELFPMIEGSELESLVADISANGLQTPIATLDGQILDGRNRLEACTRANVKPRYQEVPKGTDPVRYITSANVHRRHLTTAQRAAIAAELANLEHGSNQRVRKEEGQNCPSSGTSINEAAEMMNVSPRSVKNAKQRMRKNPEAHKAAKAGRKTRTSSPPKTKWSTIDVLHEVGLIPSAKSGGVSQRLIREINEREPGASKDATPDRFRAVAEQIYTKRNPGKVQAAAQQAKAEFTRNARVKDPVRTVAQLREELEKEIHAQLLQEAKVAIDEYKAELNAATAKAWGEIYDKGRELDRRVAHVNRKEKGLRAMMTHAEWRVFTSLCHADKWPEIDPSDKRIQDLQRLFNALQKGRDLIDPKTPIAELRRDGWEAAAPAHKRKKVA
jgi:hypothetical protein